MKEHLPDKSKKMSLIQGQVPEELYETVKQIKRETGWTWDELLTAFCKDFIKEFSIQETNTGGNSNVE
jgi:hypothetical protein